ncbi:acyl-CoA carboxylase subunit beta [Caldisericum exile]|uniref:Na(+)-transporting decarboxylase carboxyltransferase n=1 Tax=Caldisericum exile (strain DSM 21853 / NBRC 104410 / AZM16c01) TaxID=511051 RepID=A0A7U6GEY9_CALEA|nr:acyl-CoA carboxylase subunit beta [Caldisericum exile]BAL81167.1 Na(+)-transporting decarboxylase carboxyltransferase [Caldisericum exile AZM16c01]
MSIEDKLKQLEEKKSKIKNLDPQAVEKQHEKGKLTARERIDLLVDPGTFEEFDPFVKTRSTYFGLDKKFIPADGVITGIGLVNGRRVALYSQDFTSLGGSLGEMHALKIVKMQELALKLGIPFIAMNDSGGARIQEGVDSLRGYGDIFLRNVRASGVIPQISVQLGPTAGGAVYSPALMDFIIMTEKATMYITGPNVVEAVTGEKVTHEQLGGGIVHNEKSGVAHFLAKDDEDAINTVKTLLSYLPDNYLQDPPIVETSDSPNRETPSILEIVPDEPNVPFDVKDVVKEVVDENSFFEVHEDFARNAVVGFARINGRTVGIVANQPVYLAGVLDINSSDKIARFIRFCDAFNIPLITFVDTPGYMPGTAQEHGGVIRHGAKILYAYSEATVPKITIIMRKAYGGAYIAMCSRHLGADVVFAFPQAEIAVMGADGAANIIFAKEINAAENPEEMRKKKIEEYREQFSNPYLAAERGYVDDVINPKDTRKAIAYMLDFLRSKHEEPILKKHGNIPL